MQYLWCPWKLDFFFSTWLQKTKRLNRWSHQHIKCAVHQVSISTWCFPAFDTKKVVIHPMEINSKKVFYTVILLLDCHFLGSHVAHLSFAYLKFDLSAWRLHSHHHHRHHHCHCHRWIKMCSTFESEHLHSHIRTRTSQCTFQTW